MLHIWYHLLFVFDISLSTIFSRSAQCWHKWQCFILFYSWIIFHCIYIRRLCLIGNTFWLSSLEELGWEGLRNAGWETRLKLMTAWAALGSCLITGPSFPTEGWTTASTVPAALSWDSQASPSSRMSWWSVPAGRWDAQALFVVSQENPVILSLRPDMRCCCSAEVSAAFRSLLIHHTPAYYTVRPHHS